MTDQFKELFANLRRGPWNDDANSVIQEIGPRNGNIESQGWLSDNSVTADVIRANAVIAEKISAGAVETDKLAANAVTAAKISAGAIETDKLAANAVTAAKIAANTITAGQIAANTITAGEIAANTITSAEIAANTITASEIAASAITASELAADSVTTNKIVAGNVTSSRIELTLSGKNFGANNGSTSAPGVFFDENSDTGLGKSASSTTLFLSAGGATSMTAHVLGISSKDHYPLSTATYDLGASGSRWNNLYLVNSPNVSSDERTKRDIADTPLGLDFVRRLRPVAYRLAETGDTQAVEAARAAYDEAAIAAEVKPHADKIKKARAGQLAGKVTDAEAEAEVAKARERIAAIQGRHAQRIRQAETAKRPGQRLHMGLVAQQVAEALADSGVDPGGIALWTQDPEGNQGLAYLEIVPPIIRAVQEQDAEIAELRQRLAALEGR